MAAEKNIEGTLFIVDVLRGAIVEKGNPANCIRFEDMEYKGDHYLFSYDPEFKNLSAPWEEQSLFPLIRIGQMVELDKAGVAAKYGISVSEVPKQDTALKTIIPRSANEVTTKSNKKSVTDDTENLSTEKKRLGKRIS